MGYISSGKEAGATVHLGGDRVGAEGYFIEPTIFTDTKPDMKISREEIFGPVGVVIKFEDEDGALFSPCTPSSRHFTDASIDVVRQANDTMYGLAAAVFSQNINQALDTAHRLKAGTVWINSYNQFHSSVPFGGYKQSGIGRECGEYALAKWVHSSARDKICALLTRLIDNSYTNVKAVHVNIKHKM